MLKVRCLILVTVMLSSGVAFSQTVPNKSRAPKFSSVYTDMRRDCKSALTKEEERESEARGQDTPERCKGYGGYHIIVGYTGIGSEQIHIAPNHCDVCETEDIVFLNPRDENALSHPIASRIEWRLADGKPFAVIVRFSKYEPPAEGYPETSPFQDKYKVGELLLVRGLKGHERVNFDVDAKTPKANERARELADNAFLKGR